MELLIENISCNDCGKHYPLETNATGEGWYLTDHYALCPTCVRLAWCEKELHKAADDFKLLLSTLTGVTGGT